MKRYIITTILIAFTITSCENEIPFNIKDNPPILIVNALFDTENYENYVTLAMTGREKASYIYDGKVNIYVNGVLKDEVHPSHDPFDPRVSGGPLEIANKMYKTRLRFNPGDVVKIEGQTFNGSHKAWAEVTVPQPVAIEQVDTTSSLKTLNEGFGGYGGMQVRHLRSKMTFTDKADEKNFYRIFFEKHLTFTAVSYHSGSDTTIYINYWQKLSVNEDLVLTDGQPTTDDGETTIVAPAPNKYYTFDDSRINGKYTMITTFPYGRNADNYNYIGGITEIKKIKVEVKMKLLSTTQEEHTYLKALNIYDSDDYDETFSTPIRFPSNVKNGTGFVGIACGSNTTIDLGEYTPERW